MERKFISMYKMLITKEWEKTLGNKKCCTRKEM